MSANTDAHTHIQRLVQYQMCVRKRIRVDMSICTENSQNPSDTIPILGISAKSLQSQLCLERPQIPALFTWFPLSPILAAKKPE